jgi:hypothetical protein
MNKQKQHYHKNNLKFSDVASKLRKLRKLSPWYKDAIKHLYAKRALWAMNLSYTKEYKELINRIGIMIARESKRKNLRFCFQYLKDCYTVVMFNHAGSSFTKFKHHIGLDKKGWPKIIPIALRNELNNRRTFLAVTTLLGVFRIIPWWPEVDFNSITDPFNGTSRILDDSIIRRGLRNVLKWANKKFNYKLKMQKPEVLNIQSSSPNEKFSLNSSVLDAVAFWYNRGKIIPIIKWNWALKAYGLAIWFSFILIMCYPIYLIMKYHSPYLMESVSGPDGSLLRDSKGNPVYTISYDSDGYPRKGSSKEPYLGKLSVVTDVAGKSRVIAIINYWIQISLKPLHDSILKLLAEIPTDGTYDQLKPVFDLPKGIKYSSFDLSSATDRLPIDVQCQVLSHLIGKDKSDLWREIISIPLQTHSDYDHITRYSVGQPMGAYSSWAMLALTHHVLIGSLYKENEEPLYAVLGDDMCTTPDKGSGYCSLMSFLGVSISLEKSLIDSYFIEFAKKLIDKRDNRLDAIIGPKLISRSIYNKYLCINIVQDSYQRELIAKFDITNLLRRLSCRDVLDFGHFLLFGPYGLVEKDRNYALTSGLIANQFIPHPDDLRINLATFDAFGQLLLNQWRKNKKECLHNLAYLDRWILSHIRLSCPSWFRYYELCVFLISPSFILPLYAYRRGKDEPNPLSGVGSSFDKLFMKLDNANLVNFDLETKDGEQDLRRSMRTLTKEWEFSYMNTYNDIDNPSYFK